MFANFQLTDWFFKSNTVKKVGYNMVFPMAYRIQISLNINPVLYSSYTLV